MGRLVIYGAGGFGREVLTAARALPDAVLADDRTMEGVIHADDMRCDDEVVIAIADGATRRRVSSRFHSAGSVFAPTCVIGREVSIGEGAIFCDFTMVTASARIGRHFHCNIYSYVAHDCTVGDFVTFAPKVCCNGSVTIGDGAYLGTGCVLKQGVTIGAGAVIGMGAVVTRDVPSGSTVVGNPARPIQRPAHLVAA